MHSEHPFIYIAAVPRTGSTMVSEMLSKLPFAFVFHELNMGRNYFTIRQSDARQFESLNLQLPVFRKRHAGRARIFRKLARIGIHYPYFFTAFMKEIYRPLSRQGIQIGVKEIRHQGWHHYVRKLNFLKVVLLGRDPRDIYISFYYMAKTGAVHWHRPFDPITIANFYNTEFRYLMDLKARAETMSIRYEDLVREPGIPEQIKAFCESPIPEGFGDLGTFTQRYPKRKAEYMKHGGEISERSVSRWQVEKDTALVEDAHRFFELVPDFVRYWGYETSNPASP